MGLSLSRRSRRVMSRPTVVFEFGSAFTKVSYKHKLVFHQPTAFIWQQSRQRAWSLGADAVRTGQKLAHDFSLVRPVTRKLIADPLMMRHFILALLDELKLQDSLIPWKNLTVVVLLPSELPSVYQHSFKQVISSILPQAKFDLTESVLAQSSLLSGGTQFILDLGETTSLWLLINGKKMSLSHFPWGEFQLDQLLRESIELATLGQIGSDTLFELKRHLLQLAPGSTIDKKQVIKIKSKQTGLGQTVMISSATLRSAADVWLRQLFWLVDAFFAQLPGVSATDLVDNGLWLMGGLASLSGLDQALTQHLSAEVRTLPNPALFLINQASKDAG